MPIKNENIVSTNSGNINMPKIPNLTKMPSFKRGNNSILLFVPILIGAFIFSFPVNGEEELVKAARNTANCRDVIDTESRLACFDTASKRLAELLSPAKTVTERDKTFDPDSSPTESPAITATEEGPPIWAAAPQHSIEELNQEKREAFQTTIVRITVNSSGRHSFYTEEGAVWKQTQKDKVVPPKSLPAKAEIRRKRTGNPTIKFIDVSNRSYRVLRIK